MALKNKPSKLELQKRIVSLIGSDNLVRNGADLADRLKMSMSALNYYWKDLFVHGVLDKSNHVWVVDHKKAFNYFDKTPAKVTKSYSGDKKFKPNTIRSHGYAFKIAISKSIDGEKLAKRLGLRKGAKETLNHYWINNSNHYQVWFYFNNWKITIHRESIIFRMGKKVSYYGADAHTNHLHVMYDFIEKVVNPLERLLGRSLRAVKEAYDLEVICRHKAMIMNAFAKVVQDKKKLFKITVDGKLRLIIDASFGDSEFEAVDAKHTENDISVMQVMHNDILTKFSEDEPFKPSQVYDMIGRNAKNLDYHAENMISHVKAVQQLGDGVERLTNLLQNGNFIEKGRVINEEISNLEMIKSLIDTKNDVIVHKELISKLNDVDKSLLSLWLFEKFN